MAIDDIKLQARLRALQEAYDQLFTSYEQMKEEYTSARSLSSSQLSLMKETIIGVLSNISINLAESDGPSSTSSASSTPIPTNPDAAQVLENLEEMHFRHGIPEEESSRVVDALKPDTIFFDRKDTSAGEDEDGEASVSSTYFSYAAGTIITLFKRYGLITTDYREQEAEADEDAYARQNSKTSLPES